MAITAVGQKAWPTRLPRNEEVETARRSPRFYPTVANLEALVEQGYDPCDIAIEFQLPNTYSRLTKNGPLGLSTEQALPDSIPKSAATTSASSPSQGAAADSPRCYLSREQKEASSDRVISSQAPFSRAVSSRIASTPSHNKSTKRSAEEAGLDIVASTKKSEFSSSGTETVCYYSVTLERPLGASGANVLPKGQTELVSRIVRDSIVWQYIDLHY
jgi:hypothetical protein